MTTDWITAPSDNSKSGTVRNITGTKRCLKDLSISNSSYEDLPVPKLVTASTIFIKTREYVRRLFFFRVKKPLCVLEATMDDVETTLVTIGRAYADSLTAEHIFGASDLNYTITDTATSTQHLNLSSKIFTGVLNVKNASIDAIDGIDFPSEFREYSKR